MFTNGVQSHVRMEALTCTALKTLINLTKQLLILYTVTLLQVLVIEFIAFAIEFIPLANEFVTLTIEFVP